MDFYNSIAQCLQESGINLSADVIPPQDRLLEGLDKIQIWLNTLDETTKMAVDESTADKDNPIKAGISDNDVAIAPELSDLLNALDTLPICLSISDFVSICQKCVQNYTDET